MKRGIPIVLQAAGVLLACLATTLNHPVAAFERTVSMRDTAYYYNESGKLIYWDTLITSTKYYVIKTCQTKEQLFFEWYGQDTTKLKRNFDPANVNGITGNEAQEVERLISEGKISDTLVQKSILPILGKASIKKIWERIPDSGKGLTEKTDCREYGGVIISDASFTFQKGKRSDPCIGGAAVWVKLKAKRNKPKKYIGYYHSHPSGVDKNNGCAFTQAPSKDDQDALINGGVGYVFGMNLKSHRLYILNKDGVQATLPFCWLLCDPVNK